MEYGEDAVQQHFLLFQQGFHVSSSKLLKLVIVWLRVKIMFEKGELLVTSTFFFYHNIVYPVKAYH